MKILVTHPGRQHSHQAALALEAAGLLAGYWSGVPSSPEQGRVVPRPLWRRLIRYAPVPLPVHLTRWAPTAPLLRQAAHRLPRAVAQEIDFAACRIFDRQAARRLARLAPSERPGAVLACEISAQETFGVARRLGIRTWLDAPSIHHHAQDRLHGTTDSARLHARIARVKDREIELADAIVTVSELARATYVEAGIDPGRVRAVPLGADLELFAPPAQEPARGPGTVFLFAGAPIVRKGFDLLLAAFARVVAAEPSATLRVVGPRGGEAAREGMTFVGPVGQTELAAEMSRADCLVLPSRNDSYGMVVAEALAAGLPVVVSDMVGAAELVVPGENGWVVPAGDGGALSERLLSLAHPPGGPALLRSMRPRCGASAVGATWEAYRDRFVLLARELLARPAGSVR
ncbi:MAG TPA: glycosyltransferase [Thermoanaerobaculia bacterium]|jgi:glycosyltransferase involved in cell wall biosynthesis|nr:glycosyltransferase [Thermoanaerobaculia bacterium]